MFHLQTRCLQTVVGMSQEHKFFLGHLPLLTHQQFAFSFSPFTSPGLPGGTAMYVRSHAEVKVLFTLSILWACLIAALAFILLVCQCWPVPVRQSHCAWCWKALGIMRWYPRRWSATICRHHAR